MSKRTFLTLIAAVTILGSGPDGLGAEQSGDKNQTMSQAGAFLDNYQKELAKLEIRAGLAAWKAANTGKKEDFDASAEASLALRKFHSDKGTYRRLRKFMAVRNDLPVKQGRALELCELAYRQNQLPADLLEKMVKLSTEIERMFNTFRAEIDGRRLSNNDLLKMLREETDSSRRRRIWRALKQVGAEVSPKLIELAKFRNRAADKLGFDNFWEMHIRFQEHDPKQLLAIFDELQQLTGEPFVRVKRKMDSELAERFGIKPEEMMPWHYDNPFFQAAPPSARLDLDEFYKHKAKEEIVEIAREFFDDVGLPIDDIIARSDLYEREGKDQHAFCISIDRGADVRTLCNIKPTAEWMDTMLHEQGHAVYDVLIDRSMPYNTREPAHIFTTEGVAMLFGALAKTPAWMVQYAGADKERVDRLSEAIYEQRRREQLIFARWTMVMLNFEKALYEDPDRDLNVLWWDYVERFQMLNRPADRDKPDWAAKPHFTIAPVYYHNYMLGELFAAQLRSVLGELAGHKGPTAELSFNGRKEFGDFLKREVFAPGSTRRWPEFVGRATGNQLSAKHFAAEVRQ